MTPAQREAVVAEAMSWVNTPYHHHALIKGVGVDCIQLLRGVYPPLGICLDKDPGIYAVDWHLNQREEKYLEGLQAAGWVLTGAPLPGDVAVFKYGRTFSHGAILVNDNLLVHAYMNRGVMLSRVDEEPLSGHAVLYWTYP